MRYRRLTTALIVILALFITSCRSNKTITSQASNHNATDTLCQTIVHILHDTVKETTTITIQTNTDGDTTRITTLRDRQSTITRNHTALQTHQTTENSTSSQSSETTSSSHTLFPSTPTTHSLITTRPLKRLLKFILIPFLLSLLISSYLKHFRHK